MHRQYFKDFAPPYLVAFVELEAGPMLMAALANVSPDELRCELPLQASFEKLTEEIRILRFEPRRS